jgi:DNA anti-recombination protein RmuC
MQQKGCFIMPLQYQDQVNLLKDILTNHQTDCCGSVSECEQLERVIKSLLVNSNIDQNSKQVLDQIYSYSQNGIGSANLDEHIESHQQQLSQWVNNIDQLS